MTKDEIIKALRDMARYPTVTLPRDSEALKVAADLLAQPEQDYPKDFIHALAFHTAMSDLEPEQPKVRTGDCLLVGVCASEGHKIQPQRTWVGLTDEEKADLFEGTAPYYNEADYADAIEAKLKEKNT